MVRPRRVGALIGAGLLVLPGCGATTVRLALAPTLDTGGKVGVTAGLSLGVGMPVDYHDRSHHYLQALSSVGGGRDGATGAPLFAASQSLDYIRWVEPTMDVRAGAHFVFDEVYGKKGTFERYGLGAHAALLPMVNRDDTGWLIRHLCLGPELVGEVVWRGSTPLGVLSLPLVIELNLLAAGD